MNAPVASTSASRCFRSPQSRASRSRWRTSPRGAIAARVTSTPSSGARCGSCELFVKEILPRCYKLRMIPRVKPAVSWPGGKSRLLKHLLPLIPPHECYVEPFAGGLAVLLAKKRSPMEVVNDLDGDLVTFYRCVRFHTEALLTELEFVLNSRREFHDFRHQPGLTDIQRAARWYYRNKHAFGGANMDSFAAGPSHGGAHSSRAARMETIRALNVRLDKVCIEHLDWERC